MNSHLNSNHETPTSKQIYSIVIAKRQFNTRERSRVCALNVYPPRRGYACLLLPRNGIGRCRCKLIKSCRFEKRRTWINTPCESFSTPYQLFSSFTFTNFFNHLTSFQILKMIFSITTIVTFAALGLAQQQQTQAANYRWPVSDYMYRLQASQDGNTATGPQVMYTDGQNVLFGSQQNGASPSSQPLVEIMAFFDTHGNLDLSRSSAKAQRLMQENRYLAAGQQGAMQLTPEASGKWEYSSRDGDMSDVALRFNQNQQFLACPVQQRQQQTQQQQWAEGERQSLQQQGQDRQLQRAQPQQQNQQTQQQGQLQRNNDMYLVFIDNAPCQNPIKLSLSGERQNGQAHYADAILRVIAPSGQMHYSPVYNRNGRLYASSDQRPGQEVNAMRSQLSYDGHLVDTRSRQFATLGQNQQLALTDADNIRMAAKGFSVNNQGYLNFNDLQFLACNAGNNVWEIRPLGAEGATSGCSDGQTVAIRMEQAPQQQQQTQNQQTQQQQGQQLQQTRPEQNGQNKA